METTRFEAVMNEMEKVAATSAPELAAHIRETIDRRREAEAQRVLVLAARVDARTARKMRTKAALAELNRELGILEQATAAAAKAPADQAAALQRAQRSKEIFTRLRSLQQEADREERDAAAAAAQEDQAWLARCARWAVEDRKVLHG